MPKVKAGISKLNPEQLVTKANTLVLSMTANPNYVTPNPSLASVTAAKEDLQEAITESGYGNHYAVSLKRDKFDILFRLIMSLAAYVQNMSGGDALKIESSGFEVAQRGEPIGIPSVPASVKASASDTPGSGEATVEWKKVRGAKSYIVEYTTQAASAPESVWEEIKVSTKTRCTLSGLTSGDYYSFRVIAVGSAGNSLASIPATVIIG